ncbi:SDR family NAD(P)-dependent oxidoreductase, partial [Tahibacter sp.]|uniref:SDR family NAD(P)-dependent oxidoreductase n=1 Tax=Tahibacter sp. TaxID=2056211 RepID=UPI0028C44C84
MTAADWPLEHMEDSLRGLMFLQLRSLGLFRDATFTAQGEQARIDQRFARWFDESLRILERGDYLRRDGAGLVLGPRASADAGWSTWEAATAQWFEDPAFAAQARLVDAMVRALPDILTGKRLATEVLFADASVGRVEGVYQGTTGADYFNAVLAEVAAAYLEQRCAATTAADAARVRILEIGAGTGGTSAALFARLKPYEADIAEYCYTDISKAFLAHAQQRYAPTVPYLTWKLFNAEKTPQEQGFDIGAYDLVVATNVLHATRDIRNTLRNAKAALQRNGLLLLNEMHVTGSSLLAHLTFGLTDGWWLFEDDVLRVAGTPALTPDTWRAVLNAEGFEDVFFPAQAGHAFGQQVVVARSDGVVQQPVRSARKPVAVVRASAEAPRAVVRGSGDLARRARVSEALLERLCSVLKLDAGDVDIDAAFADYGLDSIVGIEFVKALNASLSLDLETTVIFDYSSISQLTSHIVARYPGTALADEPAMDDEPAPNAGAPEVTPRRTSADSAPHVTVATRNGPIAIVGMSGRFARSRDLEALWQHLANGDDLVGESTRWGAAQAGDGRYPYGSFIDGIDQFDAMFFSISGVEARYMDPKQRLFLEEAWKALEDAGYAGACIQDQRCGVYVGCEPGDYSQLFGTDVPAQAMWGNATSIVPARIAYYLDLQGAAIAVDTACSSALVAMHLGCQALWNGELDLVIAGGVSIGCAPAVYGGPAAAGMLSGTGRCHTFDAQADGFVPGEGVGAVVLRRLEDTLRDGDAMHGVIRGSGINQDGATNGITAPSARSQERLESQVYDTFGVDPDEIDLVEAHGTGTPLGDPIEINALTRAFRRRTARKRYCAIGTIKTNLGHALAASGMAGLFKVLLSLRHRQMPPSLHFHTPNPHIDLDNSPFFVNTTLREWPRGVDADGAPRPRRAALSAFGMSGTNAHVVIEEAPAVVRRTQPRPAHLMVLSARSAEQLRQQAQQLAAHCEHHADLDVGNISYTLLVGRKHFEHRLACVARSAADLAQRLQKWLAHGKAAQVYAGRTVSLEEGGQAGLKRYGQQCMHDCVPSLPADEYLERLATVADLYVQGYKLDYAALFESQPHGRLPLPTYPFATTAFWHDGGAAASVEPAGARALHPLVQENTSDVQELRFSSLIGAGQEAVEHGMLTSVAQLEMAYVALAHGAGWRLDEDAALVLHDVQWGAPVVVGDAPARVHIGLYERVDGAIDYEIYSECEDGERTVHGLGRGERAAVVATPMDDTALRMPLLLPDTPADERYGLRPALLQQAAQAALRLAGASDGAWQLQGVARVDVLAALRGSGEARVQTLAPGDDGTYRCHVQLCDAQQRVCVVLHDLTMSPAPADGPVPVAAAEPVAPVRPREPVTQMTMRERWAAHTPMPGVTRPKRVLYVAANAMIAQQIAQEWRELDADVELIRLWFADASESPAPDQHAVVRNHTAGCRQALNDIARHYGEIDAFVYAGDIDAPAGEDDWRSLLPLLQGLFTSGLTCGRLLVCAAYGDALSRCHAESWIGITRSARVLAPQMATAVLLQHGALHDADGTRQWARHAWQALCAGSLGDLRYDDDGCHALRVEDYPLADGESGLRAGGVYWITGGAGGLGGLMARHLLERYSAKVVLSGRRELDEQSRAELQTWTQSGGEVLYVMADVTDEAAMRTGVAQAVERFGAIEGVIHAAGLLDAESLLDKSADAFARVLAPKVRGTQVLDAVLQDQPLAFVCYFSSAAAVLGDFGSADYALGNRFEMAYAEHCSGPGRRMAIAWPVWADSGIQVGDAAANTTLYLQASGQVALTAQAGIDVLERALAQVAGHCLVMVGQRTRIERALGLHGPRETGAPKPPLAAAVGAAVPARRRAELRGLSLEDCVQWDLRTQIGELLKLPRDQLQAQANLADFGFDSLMLAQWAKQISAHYGIELTPAVFFSHATLERVAAHLLEQHRARVEARYRETEPAPARVVPQATATPLRSRRAGRRTAAAVAGTMPGAEPIAIIGMSGRFPQARSVDALWRILAEGRSAVEEVALERFDWRAAYAAGMLKSKWLGAMPGVDEFEPAFFEISPREAQVMDPRQRLLLQEAWNALEDAGYGTPQLARHTVGMFVGVEQGEYQLMVGPQGTLTGTHDGILASRLCYFLDLHGPAMAINTSCSSGLVAAHQACLSLRAGECDTAIAASASLSLTAEAFAGMSQAGMLSEDGRCYAFDRRANGMVPGEAVVALVLKRLSQAEADGDPIRAVILGSGINYDGKTNGITAPNGALQAALIRDVYARANVTPDDIDYVVAHGTGTRLGDPVEVDALREVFGARAKDAAPCAITSTKSNLGHAFAASGLVSLVSAVLALSQEAIPPSVHCEELSDYIDWQAGAIEVNRTLRPWSRTPHRRRMAGVSAFGMSGTNAHMLVQEYVTDAPPVAPLRSVPLMLSATSAAALQQKMDALISVLRDSEWDAAALTATSYTLLCGRQHFTHRCAVVAGDREQALQVLSQARAGERGPNVFRGVAPREFAGQRALQQTGEALLERLASGVADDAATRDALHALADLYCQGYALPWATLFGAAPPRRLALPTYPFARESHWIEATNDRRAAGPAAAAVPAAVIHPLLQRNTSTLAAQRFTSTFDGSEPLLRDHRVGGVPTLAGVCYLEMAHAALRASSEDDAAVRPTELRDVVWIRPLAVTARVDVHTRLTGTADSEVAFEVSAAGQDGEEATLAQGRLLYIGDSRERVDLAQLRARCSRTLSADACYRLLNGPALEYGPALRGLVAVHLCDDADAPFVLAQLQLPADASDAARYTLYPGVLDSALQAAAGLSLLTSQQDNGLLGILPFAVESVQVLAPTPSVAWAYLRLPAVEGARHAAPTIAVDVCDDTGRVCVAVRGLSLLSPRNASETAAAPLPAVRTVFRGDEYFLEDHDHVVPGVVYLRIAREAGEHVLGRRVSGLANVVWRAPMKVTPETSVLVTRLDPTGGFTIASESDAVCAQGMLMFEEAGRQPPAPRHDLDAIRRRCADGIEGHRCHELLGVVHGPRMFPIENLAFGDREALARLVLRDTPDEADELHPAMLHGTVLAAIAYSFIQDGRPAQLRLPFALEALRIHAPVLPSSLYAYVRQCSADGAPTRTYDIDLVTDAGECLVAFEGLTALPIDLPPRDEALRAIPFWQDHMRSEPADETPADALVFVLAADDEALRQSLRAEWPTARIEVLDAETSAAAVTRHVTAVMALLQDCLQTAHATTRVTVLVPDDDRYPAYAALVGLLRTARVENPRLVGTLLACAPDDPVPPLERLRAELTHPASEAVVRYRDGVRQVVRWQELAATATTPDDPSGLLLAGDVVWITGGLGGIGRILARWFCRVDGVRVVLSGRSPADDDAEQWLRSAREDGLDVTYLRGDVSRRSDVEAILASDAVNGRLRGIVHCAATLRDAYLAHKTPADVQAVFAPKVDGTLNLDEATRDLPLAFFALFSSFSAVLGNPGQADYAGANAFLDAFAIHRNTLVERGTRSGHSCSINWPLWKDGGMQVDTQTEQLMRSLTGLAPLESAHALRAFASALHGRHARMLVAQGQTGAIRVAVLGHAPTPGVAAPVAVAAVSNDTAGPADAVLTQRLVRELAAAAAAVLKLRTDAIDADTELSHYGFDSIYLTEFANQLNRAYGLRLMPTVFFECPTLAALARHLLARYGGELRTRWNADAPDAAPAATRAAAVPVRSGRAAPVVRPRSTPTPTPSPGDLSRAREPVAVVGMSGRFPGSADVDAFWTHLVANDDLIGEVPADRWAWMHSLGTSAAALPASVRLGGFMADVDCFDPLFFGISPLEAVAMDPQQRLFIEMAWACVEDAGYRPGSLAGSRTGVFVGVSTSDYKDLCQLAGASVQFGGDSAFHFMIANRLSYLLDLRGPSESVDTACSSSLVALHRAVGALASGECAVALVGGVNVIANPVNSVRAHDAGILSSDGRCKTFDQDADGYGRGEGVAVLMLKPLRQAQADRDHIYGLVCGSAENHGGRAASPTAPNPLAQQQLLVDAYQAADIDICTVGYIEAHGTGTVLGDPIEFNALKAAFRELYQRQDVEAPAQPHCVLGSVKSNIGHLEAAAGVAGVVKVLLMMQHGRIPGNPHLASPNRYLELHDGPFRLARETGEWAAPRDAAGATAPRRAGVSSFGIGGANAHVVLEEYRAPADSATPTAAPALVVVSARTRERLEVSVRRLLQALEQREDLPLHDIAYTLQIGRDAMEHRLAFVVMSVHELRDGLSRYLQGERHGGYENEAGKHRDLFSSLVGEQALALTVDTWVRQGEYAKLAELWSKGLPFDWQRLYAGSALHAALAPRRVSLP